LFRTADVQGHGNIGGAQAVQFFARSKLPIDVLKNIWTVADQPSTSSLDHKKFAVAVRLIQLTQNGQKGTGSKLLAPPGVSLRPVFFEGVSGVSVQVPTNAAQPPPPQQQQQQMSSPPHPTPQQPQRSMPPPQPTSPNRSPQRQMQQPQMQQQQPPPTPSRALVGMDPYLMSPQERSRYESLFPQYAKTAEDGSGLQFVYGSEAVPLFMKSGVDASSLRDIWNMVDRNPVDNRLDKLEFALAMHLIVCLSKKNLPVPQGGTLPNSLKALKVAASGGTAPNSPMRGGPSNMMPPPQQQQQQMSPPPQQQQQQQQVETVPQTQIHNAVGPPPLGSDGGMGGMSISDAFEGLNMGNEPPPQPTPTTPLPSYVPEQQEQPTYNYDNPSMAAAEPAQPTPQPSYVHQPDPVMTSEQVSPPPVSMTMASAAPPPAAASKPYEVGDTHEELDKLKIILQKLQAENISLKAQLGNMTDEEKQVQHELGATIAEISSLSTDLGSQRQLVLEAKNRLLEAKAELKAQRESKSVLTELIGEAQQTAGAIEDATETILSANQAVANATTEMQYNQVGESNDLYGAPMTQFNQGQEQGHLPTPQPQRPLVESFMGMPGDDDANLTPGSRNSTHSAQNTPSRSSIPETGFAGASPMPASDSYNNDTALAPSSSADQPTSMYANYGAPPPASYPDPQQNYGAPPPASYPDPQQNYGAPPPASYPDPQQNYGAPAAAAAAYNMGPAQVQQQQQHQLSPTNIDRPNALGSHNRQLSGFNAEYLMGGAAPPIEPDATDTEQQHHQQQQEAFSVAARSHASSGDYGYDDQAFEIVDEMKKKARQADKAAREAEVASRKLAAEADELRNDADKAEAMSRSLQAASEEKKKGRFGGGKKKKLQESAEQAAKDSAAIKKQFMTVQTQAYEAASLAATTRSGADRLREEAESAELQMASAASTAQKQPAQAPAPAPPVNNNNGSYGYGAPSPKPDYGGMPPKQQPNPAQYGQGMQMMMPHPGPANGGYNNYGQQQPYGGGAPAPMSLPNPSPEADNGGFAPMGGGGMGGGGGDFAGYDLPSPSTFAPAPGMAPAADPYASPF
jgi:hypothetical protein